MLNLLNWYSMICGAPRPWNPLVAATCIYSCRFLDLLSMYSLL